MAFVDVYAAVDGPLAALQTLTAEGNYPFPDMEFRIFGVIYAPRAIPPKGVGQMKKDWAAHFVLVAHRSHGDREGAARTGFSRWWDPVTERPWGIAHRLDGYPLQQLADEAAPILLHDLVQRLDKAQAAEILAALQEAALKSPQVHRRLGDVRDTAEKMLYRLRVQCLSGSPLLQRRDVVPLDSVDAREEFRPTKHFPAFLAQGLPFVSVPLPRVHSAEQRLLRACATCAQECREEFATSSVQQLLPVDFVPSENAAYVLGGVERDAGALAHGFFLFFSLPQLETWSEARGMELDVVALQSLLTNVPFGIITGVAAAASRLRVALVHSPEVAALSDSDARHTGEYQELEATVDEAADFTEAPVASIKGALLVLATVHEQAFCYQALRRAVNLLAEQTTALAELESGAGSARPTREGVLLRDAWRRVAASAPLSEAQRAVVQQLAGATGRIVALEGSPGCGKSFLLLRLARALLDTGFPDLLVVYVTPTRVLRDEMLAEAGDDQLFPREAERLILGRSDVEEDAYVAWLLRRMEEGQEPLMLILLSAEAFFAGLPKQTPLTWDMQRRAAQHHDATFALYVRQWQFNREDVFRGVRFVAMTRTMCLKCLGRLAAASSVLKGRQLAIIADEIEDWSEAQFLAVAGHSVVTLASGDADQTLRPVQRLLPQVAYGDLAVALEPMQGVPRNAYDALRDTVPTKILAVTMRFGPWLLDGYRAMAPPGSRVFDSDTRAPPTRAALVVMPADRWRTQAFVEGMAAELSGRTLPGPDVLAVLGVTLLRAAEDGGKLMVLSLYDQVVRFLRAALTQEFLCELAGLARMGGVAADRAARVLAALDLRTVRSARGATADTVLLLAHKRYAHDQGMQGYWVDDSGMRRVAFSRAKRLMVVLASRDALEDASVQQRVLPGFRRLAAVWPMLELHPDDTCTTAAATQHAERTLDSVHVVRDVHAVLGRGMLRLHHAAQRARAGDRYAPRPAQTRQAVLGTFGSRSARTPQAAAMLSILADPQRAVDAVAELDRAVLEGAEAHNRRRPPIEPEPEEEPDTSTRAWLRSAQRYIVPTSHWHVNPEADLAAADPRHLPHLVAIPFFQEFLPDGGAHEWTEHLHLAKLFCPPRHELRVLRHKGHVVRTSNATHYWRECRSTRSAVAVLRRGEMTPRLYAYHGMGTHRMLSCLQGVVLRVADVEMLQFVAARLGEHFPTVSVRPDNMVVWNADVGQREQIVRDIAAAWQAGSGLRVARQAAMPPPSAVPEAGGELRGPGSAGSVQHCCRST